MNYSADVHKFAECDLSITVWTHQLVLHSNHQERLHMMVTQRKRNRNSRNVQLSASEFLEPKIVRFLVILLRYCRGFEKMRQLRMLTTRERRIWLHGHINPMSRCWTQKTSTDLKILTNTNFKNKSSWKRQPIPSRTTER